MNSKLKLLSIIFIIFLIQSFIYAQKMENFFDTVKEEHPIIKKIKEKYLSLKTYQEVGIFQ
jgi:type II secretory pathway component PulF